MPLGKFLGISDTGQMQEEQAIAQSSGVVDANKIPRTGSDGRLDETLFPPGFGIPSRILEATEDLVAGDWVNVYHVGGVERVRKANATDVTKPACGYVKESVTTGFEATIYTDGNNDAIPVGAFVPADVGRTAFLSTTGGVTTLAPPTSSGNLLQSLGDILEVGATHLVVSFHRTPGIVRV